ncbi:type V toxin-antitoxin system endoribonuclease antitoxin GhoS, partial [Citrobacter amalonaticus]
MLQTHEITKGCQMASGEITRYVVTITFHED